MSTIPGFQGKSHLGDERTIFESLCSQVQLGMEYTVVYFIIIDFNLLARNIKVDIMYDRNKMNKILKIQFKYY